MLTDSLVVTEEMVRFHLSTLPISIQSRKQRRDRIHDEVAEIMKGIDFLFTQDVSVSIQLMMNERKRYETDQSPDLDNVIKPLTDALHGPTGLMIDDNQVQRTECYWIDVASEAHERITVEVTNITGDTPIDKNAIGFVRIDGPLYFPLDLSLPLKALETMVEYLQRVRRLQAKAEDDGFAQVASGLHPIQRYFHKSRLRGFRLLEPSALAADRSLQ
jgi:Holliday junction resolvase RusA-like endonuclease